MHPSKQPPRYRGRGNEEKARFSVEPGRRLASGVIAEDRTLLLGRIFNTKWLLTALAAYIASVMYVACVAFRKNFFFAYFKTCRKVQLNVLFYTKKQNKFLKEKNFEVQKKF